MSKGEQGGIEVGFCGWGKETDTGRGGGGRDRETEHLFFCFLVFRLICRSLARSRFVVDFSILETDRQTDKNFLLHYLKTLTIILMIDIPSSRV